MELQTETYLLLHRMLEAAETKEDLEIVRRNFQAVVDDKRGSMDRGDRFDEAWSTSCLAGIYVRLEQPLLAEQSYLTAIRLFDDNDMAAHSSCLSVVLAKLYAGQGRIAEAEIQMKAYVSFETKDWGVGSEHAMGAHEELVHFQNTGQFIQAFEHKWCKPCGIDVFGVGFDEDD